MSLTFGVTVLPDPPYTRMIELMKVAEGQGFEYAWTYDSHILWQDSYATLALAAAQTKRIKLGHFVTNPGIRDPTIAASWYATVHDVSNGRMAMGIGRGDSSRRVVGLQPVRVAEFERRCATSCRTSRCGSRAMGRRRSPSPGASLTASSSSSRIRRSSSGSWTRLARRRKRSAATRAS